MPDKNDLTGTGRESDGPISNCIKRIGYACHIFFKYFQTVGPLFLFYIIFINKTNSIREMERLFKVSQIKLQANISLSASLVCIFLFSLIIYLAFQLILQEGNLQVEVT